MHTLCQLQQSFNHFLKLFLITHLKVQAIQDFQHGKCINRLNGRFYTLEGAIAIVMAAATWFYLPSFPETCSFLNAADRVLASARGRDGYDQEELTFATKSTRVETRAPIIRFNYVQFLDIIQDTRIWCLSVSYLFVTAAVDYIIVLTPEVAAESFGLGKPCLVNCDQDVPLLFAHGIPFLLEFTSLLPFVISLVSVYLIAIRSDKSGERALHGSFGLLISAAGFLFLALLPANNPTRYFFGLIPAICGIVTATPCILSYAMDHASGDTQRATAAAITVGLGQSFGLLLTALEQLVHTGDSISNPTIHWIVMSTLIISTSLLLMVRKLNQAEEQSMWGKAPGLRRLLNDADESKAWDVELVNVAAYLKTEPVNDLGGSWESSDEV